MVGVLAVGFVANLLIRPVRGALPREADRRPPTGPSTTSRRSRPSRRRRDRGSSSQGRLVLSWLLVVLLLGYGVVQTLTTAAKLFG